MSSSVVYTESCIELFATNIYNLGKIPLYEQIYVHASDFKDLKDVERVRRHLIKYKQIFGELWKPALDDPIANLDPPTDIIIHKNNGRLHIQTPFNQEFVHRIGHIKGRIWDGTYNTIPYENGIPAIKVIERVFSTYIDIDIPEAVYAGVGMDETLRAIKIASFVDNDVTRKTLQKFGARYDSFSMTWNIVVQSGEQLDSLVAHLRSYPLVFKFISVTDARLDKLRRLVETDSVAKSELFQLSRTAGIDTNIRCPDGMEPYPFQVVGVKFIEKTNGRTLVADEMGLGKTIEALLYLYNHPDALPCVVVAPSNIKIKWFRETKKWLNIDESAIAIVSGKNSRGDDDMPLDRQVYILNYDIVNGRYAEMLQIPFKTVIIDEAHYVKNTRAKRSKAVLELCKRVEHVICLTGTPIVNRPIELWNVLVATKNTHHFGGFMDYATRYCAAFKSRFGWDFGGASHLNELHQKLREIVMIRRLKSQVLDQLPPKQRIVIPVQIHNRATYNKAMNNFKRWYKETKRKDLNSAEAMVKIEYLKQLAYKGKQEEVMDFIDDAHENDGKIIVFTYHVEFLEYILTELAKTRVFVRFIKAGMSNEERQRNIDEFNECDDGIVVCSLKVANVGIDLQTASTVIFTELAWTPSDHVQAEDRAHRIGQTEIVKIYYIIGIDTIDEDIMDIIEGKQRVIDRTLDHVDDPGTGMTGLFLQRLHERLRD
jgi:SWI/SNF-related matrix-associated actin-dependent regulator 1 of chromatin subfamily A